MKNSQFSLITTIFFALIAFAWNGCSDTSGPEEDVSPYSVYPTSGPPGMILSIRGVNTTGLDQNNLSIEIAGEAAPASIDHVGNIVTAIPMFLAQDGFPDPVVGSANIRVLSYGQPLVTIENMLTIEEFPVAPGMFDAAVTEMEQIAGTIEDIAQFLILAPGEGEQYSTALLAGLDTLLNGTGEYSLAAVLEGQTEDSVAVAILNGLYDANGLVEHLQLMSQMLDDIYAETGVLRTENNKLYTIEITSLGADPYVVDDDLLALMMQVYVVMEIFGQEFIAETGTEFANTVGTIIGALGLSGAPSISGPTRMVAITQIILAYLDFVVNKVALGLLPAHLDSLNLELAEYELVQGAYTNASIEAHASNEPPTITLNYIVGNTLTLLGLEANSTAINPIRQLLEDIAAFFLAEAQSRFSQYADAHPDLELDVELGSVIPDMTWRAVVDDYRLLECHSDDHNLLTPLQYDLNWEASSVNEGYVDIWLVPSMDSDAHVLPAVLPINYVGGAFGSDLTMSERVEVEILGRLALQLDFPSQIDAGGAGVLGIRAGYREEDGSITWSPDINISIIVTGGTPEESIGITDTEGHFSTVVWADIPGAQQIEILVMASGDYGSFKEKDITASIDECGGESISINWNCPASLACGDSQMLEFCSSWTLDETMSGWQIWYYERWEGEWTLVESIGGHFDQSRCGSYPIHCYSGTPMEMLRVHLRVWCSNEEPTSISSTDFLETECYISAEDTCTIVPIP